MRLARAALVMLGMVAGPAAAAPASADSLPNTVSGGLVRLRSFGTSEGLHNLAVVSIVQDPRGYLWLGSDDGIDRYDGDRFTHFGLEQGLASTAIHVLGLGPDGRVCAGSTVGLVCWDGTRFSRTGSSGLPEVAVTSIAATHERLWVGTAAGLYVRAADGLFVRASGWPSTEAVEAMSADPRGLIVAGQGNVRTSDGDGVWRSLSELGLTGDHVDDVLRDARGGLWIRTSHHLWRLVPGERRFEDLGAGLPASYRLGGSGSMINGVNGEVLIGTDSGIAYRDGDRWQMIHHGTEDAFAGARTMFVDHEGTTWIGGAGLFQWRGRGLIERHDASNGLPGNVVWSVARDRDRTLWVGTNLCLARMLGGSWQCLSGSQGRVVRSFAFPPQGGVFLGGVPSDLVYVDPEGKSTALGSGVPESTDHAILALQLGPEGDLWIGTRTDYFACAAPGPERSSE